MSYSTVYSSICSNSFLYPNSLSNSGYSFLPTPSATPSPSTPLSTPRERESLSANVTLSTSEIEDFHRTDIITLLENSYFQSSPNSNAFSTSISYSGMLSSINHSNDSSVLSESPPIDYRNILNMIRRSADPSSTLIRINQTLRIENSYLNKFISC